MTTGSADRIVLWEHPLSPYAQKVKIALRLKGLEFDAQMPMGLGADAVSALKQANPRSEVPTLAHEGQQLFDSTVILEYIEDRFPEPALLPVSAADRARSRTIEDVMDTHYEAINWGLGEIHYFQRAQGGVKEQIVAAATRQTKALQHWLEQQLAGRSWFGNTSFGWADLGVVPYLNGSASFDLGPEPGSELASWLERANDVPAVAQTAAEALEAAQHMAGVADLVKAGAFKRHYRDHRLEWMIKSGGISVVVDGLENEDIRFTDF